MDINTHPPPVPPKDTPTRPNSRLSQTPASASKRKHQEYLTGYSDVENERNSPKRHRLTPPLLDTDASESSPRRSALRRKKGVNNLSHLNLRHKAEQDETIARGSRFQEGSLTDKPSEKPPSAFTRILSNNLDSLDNVDALMSEYHNGMPTPGESVDGLHEQITAPIVTTQPSGLYRFGQKLANTFKPMAYFSKMFNETKEELTAKNIEAERRRLEKEEAETQYQTLKRNGQIPRKRTSFANFSSLSQRDSGIGMVDEDRVSGFDTSMRASSGQSFHADSSAGTSEADGEKTLRGRFHLKRPSISNLRRDLKRVKSDVNLFGHHNRESSGSLSPIKVDDTVPELRPSHSKIDPRKHHKLKKRVSDLESKLQQARRELEESLIEASPVAKPSGKYERFNHCTAAKRFVPGLLPSLPSERLLDAQLTQQNMQGQGGWSNHSLTIDEQANEKVQESEMHGSDKDKTIRASHARVKPRHINDLFYEEATAAMEEVQHNAIAKTSMDVPFEQLMEEDFQRLPSSHVPVDTTETSDVDVPRQAALAEMGPPFEEEPVAEATPKVKPARKKKRKSGDGDKPYKLGDKNDDDGDDLIQKKKPAKKRKSGDKSKSSPKVAAEEAPDFSADECTTEGHYTTEPAPQVADEERDQSFDTPAPSSVRLSIDSSHSLEPVYEEDEEITSVPLNAEPPKPTAMSTPARFSRIARSTSPVKRGAEETVITRAAYAVKKHPGRLSRSRSPNKTTEGFEWPDDVF